jgi:hypothetical protein
MRTPLDTPTALLFDVSIIASANLPARNKKPWIKTKDDLSFSSGPWAFREPWSVALFASATHFLFAASPRRFVKLF